MAYRSYRRGERLPRALILRSYFIADFLALGLEEPPYGDQWIRFGPDALLIDPVTGQVLDAVYGVYDDGGYVPPPPEDEDAAPPPATSWGEEPTEPHDRLDWLEERVRTDGDMSVLSRDGVEEALKGIGDVRSLERELRDRDGGVLTEADRQYIEVRVDDISRRIRWMEQADQ